MNIYILEQTHRNYKLQLSSLIYSIVNEKILIKLENSHSRTQLGSCFIKVQTPIEFWQAFLRTLKNGFDIIT